MNQEVQIEQQPKKKAIYKKWWFWVAIVAVVIIIVSSLGSGEPTDLVDLPENEYRAQCQEYSYDDIARYPDNYQKKLAKFTGEVVQVLHDGDKIQMRVDVTLSEYGFYEDTVFVFFTPSNGQNILEGDIIECIVKQQINL